MKKLLLLITGLLLLFSVEGQILRYSNYTAPVTPPSGDPPACLSTNTFAWYVADSDYLTLSGSAVSQWDDISGNENHLEQATAENQPTFSTDEITFDGSNDLMVASISSTALPVTIYAVFTLESFVAYSYKRLFDFSNTNYLVQGDSSPSMNIGSLNDASTAISVGNRQIFVVHLNGTTASFYIDDDAGVSGDMESGNLLAINIGSRYPNNYYANVSYAEIIVRTVNDNSTDEAAIWNYLNTKYSLGL